MARYRAVVEYDGTGYAGFQRLTRRAGAGPAGPPSIQETLEAALAQVLGAPAQALGAGRTDAGAHARGQVAAWDAEWRHGPEALLRALNATLPEDIVLREVAEAAPGFHPRFDARSRTYEYALYVAPVRPALGRQYAWHRWDDLNAEALQAAAERLVGEHDFATFGQPMRGAPGSAGDAGKITVRRVLRAEWHVQPPYWIFEIEANAFLQRMVRSLVGTLRAVGARELSVDGFAEVLAAADRRRSGPAAPAHGLCLTRVTY
jgi:tRNA pseudouridine38-40 synthase